MTSHSTDKPIYTTIYKTALQDRSLSLILYDQRSLKTGTDSIEDGSLRRTETEVHQADINRRFNGLDPGCSHCNHE